jgi:hypothetical protein
MTTVYCGGGFGLRLSPKEAGLNHRLSLQKDGVHPTQIF